MTLSLQAVRTIILGALNSLSVPADQATVVADNLLSAELRGIASHGVCYLPPLAARIEAGLLAIPTRIRVIADRKAVVHLDGGNGLGQVAAAQAMRRAIKKARRFGIGLSLIRNTNHVGILSYYTKMAGDEGMIGISMCNSAPSVAPWGGSAPFFGTNPVSIGAPSEAGKPVILDMATAVVARGKIRRAARQNLPIPEGWALDERGAPTTDPARALAGTLLPIGGAKGAGLAFFIDLLVGLLSGSKFSRELTSFHELSSATGVGALMLAIDVKKFMPLAQFRELMRKHVREIRESTPAPGTLRIYLPGEMETEREQMTAAQGITIDDETRASLAALLQSQGLSNELSLLGAGK